MRTSQRFFLLLALCLGLIAVIIGCTARSASLPDVQQLREYGSPLEDRDMAALARGRTLLITECASCHRLYWPREYPSEAWTKIAEDMGRRASLSRDQVKDVEAYLVESARLTRKRED